MASILEQAMALFAQRPLKKVEVPEWSEDPAKPVVIYFKSPSPAVIAKAMGEANGNAIEQGARLVALVAMNEAGELLFGSMDYKTLMMGVDPRGLARVYNAINGAGRVTEDAVERAEKN